MIYLTDVQKSKVELLDKLLSSLSLDDLKQVVELEIVVSKLKGNNQETTLIGDLIRDNELQNSDITILKSDMTLIKSDMMVVLKAIVKPYDQYTISELNNLKSRHGIY